jgi:hypothetical protein
MLELVQVEPKLVRIDQANPSEPAGARAFGFRMKFQRDFGQSGGASEIQDEFLCTSLGEGLRSLSFVGHGGDFQRRVPGGCAADNQFLKARAINVEIPPHAHDQTRSRFGCPAEIHGSPVLLNAESTTWSGLDFPFWQATDSRIEEHLDHDLGRVERQGWNSGRREV